MISQWKQQLLQGVPVDLVEMEEAPAENAIISQQPVEWHPLKVSNTNRSLLKSHQSGPLQLRKRAYLAPTEVQGHLLIRAGAVSRRQPVSNENMIPPGKKKMKALGLGDLLGNENDRKQQSLLHPKKRSAEKYQLRQSPRPKVRH